MYEYRCPNCGKVFEQLRRFFEADHEAECPHCQAKVKERILSMFATGGCNAPGGRGFR